VIVMSHSNASIIRYAGTFRFSDRVLLEHALARARAHISNEEDLAALGGGWLRCFVMFDVTLTVNIALPAMPDHRFAAAEIFACLSSEAIEGAVTATIDDVPVEQYAVTPVRAGRAVS
jgi:hypothetical protein